MTFFTPVPTMIHSLTDFRMRPIVLLLTLAVLGAQGLRAQASAPDTAGVRRAPASAPTPKRAS